MVYCLECLKDPRRRFKLNELRVEGPFLRTATKATRTVKYNKYRLTCPDPRCPLNKNPKVVDESGFSQIQIDSAQLLYQSREIILKARVEKKQKKEMQEYYEKRDVVSAKELSPEEKRELGQKIREIRRTEIKKILGDKALEDFDKRLEKSRERRERETKEEIRREAVAKQKLMCPYCRQMSVRPFTDPNTGSIYYKCINPECLGELNNDPGFVEHYLPGETIKEKIKNLRKAAKDDHFREVNYLDASKQDIEEVLGKIDQKRHIFLEDLEREQASFTKFFGKRSRVAAQKMEIMRKEREKLDKKYENEEITKAEYEKRKEELNKRIYPERQDIQDEMVRKLNELTDDLNAGKISKEEHDRRAEIIEKEARDKKRGSGGFYKFLGKTGNLTSSLAPKITEVIVALAIALGGAIIAMQIGNMWFFWGLLSLSAYILIPSPHDYKQTPGPFGATSFFRDTHSGVASFKSLLKILVIVCISLGFHTMGDIFNIPFLITVFVGYFSLKVEYSNHAEFIESFARFFFLGAMYIPFYVFGGIFDSYVLVAIALAFFAIPPLPKASVDMAKVLAQGLSGATQYYQMFDKVFFTVLMGFALLGSGVLSISGFGFDFVGWELTGTLKSTFIWFWLVSFISGWFSPPDARPVTGLFMLGGATVIYGVGPGSQEVGQALLGEWWPTVNEAITETTKPIADVFGQVGGTFGNAFLLLTNPVGYATQIMNGSYAQNPYGATGAFGVELDTIDISPIFVNQPYMFTVKLKNEGAHKAENIMLNIQMGIKKPSLGGLGTDQVRVIGEPDQYIKYIKSGSSLDIDLTNNGPEIFRITEFGFSQGCNQDSDHEGDNILDDGRICLNNVIDLEMLPQDIRQKVFTSQGIPKDVIAENQLRAKSLPFFAMVTYDYEVDSSMTVEFMTQEEWDRLAREDSLVLRREIPMVSTSPVQFPIATLEQPILADSGNPNRPGTPFYLGLRLESNEGDNSRIEQVYKVELRYPKVLGDSPECTPANPVQVDDGDDYILVWSSDKQEFRNIFMSSGSKTIICSFDPLAQDKLESSPTKTYLIEAHAEYQFSRWEQEISKIEFGGQCVTNGDCTGDYICSDVGICVPEDDFQPVEPDTEVERGQAGYCEWKATRDLTDLCMAGEGECRNNDECDQYGTVGATCVSKDLVNQFKFREYPDVTVPVDICCRNNELPSETNRACHYNYVQVSGST